MKVLQGRWLALESQHEKSSTCWQEIQTQSLGNQVGILSQSGNKRDQLLGNQCT